MSAYFPSEMADDVDDILTPLISDFDVSTVLIFSSQKVNFYSGFILAGSCMGYKVDLQASYFFGGRESTYIVLFVNTYSDYLQWKEICA